MSDALQMPARARVTFGAFLAGAGTVGLIWALTTRTALPAHSAPEPFVLEPAPTNPPVTTEPEQADTPDAASTPDVTIERPPGTLTPEQWATIGPTYHPSPPTREEGAGESASADDTAPSEQDLPVVYLDERERASESETATPDEQPQQPRSAVQPIRINLADASELQLLPGIGPVLAQRIVDDRSANGPFRNAADLQRVKGIGEKTSAKLAPMIAFD